MDKEIVISAVNLSKYYYLTRNFFSFFSKNKNIVKALNGIDLSIKKGEIVGIIGKNGSGKSTLLKVLSLVTKPTTGTAIIDGKVVSAIEVSGGFNPDLSGTENLKLLCGIWGMKPSEFKKSHEEIIDFCDLHDFMHLQVKKFSTGMIGRLAASIIIHINADIYLFDEVLNGSDQQFQYKLHNKIIELQSNNKTILFATHNVGDILALCNRAIIFDSGKIIFSGNPIETVVKYRKLSQIQFDIQNGDCNNSKELNINKNNFSINHIKFIANNNALSFSLLPHNKSYHNFEIYIIINNTFDLPIAHSSFFIEKIENEIDLQCTFPVDTISNGNYTITMAATFKPDTWVYYPRILEFNINNNNKIKNELLPGIFLKDAIWKINN